jgi:glycosyltransferase involved in cell wall biosynthesis
LLVSRLVPYKRIDLAISAFNNLPYKLVIVGEGADKKRLKSLSSDKIIFTGKLPQRKLITYYQHAKGLIFPTEEDFGIVSIEAQSAGKPVVAFKAGGAAETVLDGKTGVLFKEPTPEALINAVNRLERLSISPEACRQQASNFSIAKFNRSLLQFVEESWQKHQQ